jgi:hypothetical protein
VSLMITVLTFFSKSSLCGVSELDHHKASDIRLPEIFTLYGSEEMDGGIVML